MSCQHCGSNIGEREEEETVCLICGRASDMNGELVKLTTGSIIIQDHKRPQERRRKTKYRSFKYD